MRVKWNRNLDGFSRVDPRNGYTTLRSSRQRLPSPLNDDYRGNNRCFLPNSGQEKKDGQRCGILHILKCRECCADPVADQGTKQPYDVNDNSSHSYTRLFYQEVSLQNCKSDRHAQKCPTTLLDNDDQDSKHGGEALDNDDQDSKHGGEVVEEYENNFKVTKEFKSKSSRISSDVEPIPSISSLDLPIFSGGVPSVSSVASNGTSARVYLPTLNDNPKHSTDNSPRPPDNRKLPSQKTKPRYLKIEDTIGLGRLSPLTKQEAEIISARRSAFKKKNQSSEDVSEDRSCNGNSYDCLSSNQPLHRSCNDNSSTVLPLVFFHGSSRSVKDNNLTPPPGYKIMRIKPHMSPTLPVHLKNLTDSRASGNIHGPHVLSSSEKEAVHVFQNGTNNCCEENNDECSKSFCKVETHQGQTVLQMSSDLKPTSNSRYFGNVESPYDTRKVKGSRSYLIPRANNADDLNLHTLSRYGQLYEEPFLCRQRYFTVSKIETVQAPSKKSNQGQTKVRSSLAPSVTGERRKTQGEYLLEIQRLGALCETRTKELNWLKLQLKHTTLGFDSFTVLIKYLTDDVSLIYFKH
ncbi:uncharacterized protein LOC106475897 [Limulus polyphemus]|uniref:Uncharacterized protein LOC106475897 n=1 Tax=Limulus polyphemus TaxID=6850 RepID=A0ABM1RW61_LIMPO|nr:uncharacterized protein LOC106475897 [Limulus polyphemus]